MDQFVTTYRKDYLWPYVRHFGHRLIEPQSEAVSSKPCPCPVYNVQKRPNLNPEDVKTQDWSREGPMGILLDPKLYPVKFAKSPEADNIRIDQPNVFVKKLQEKYPYLYEILKSAPNTDLLLRVNKDRLKTTYQVDYCHSDELPTNNILRAQGVSGVPPCPEPVVLPPGDPCTQIRKTPAFKTRSISKSYNKCQDKNGSNGGGGGGGGGNAVWSWNKTEYQDGVSKIGSMIIRDKLHYHSSKKF